MHETLNATHLLKLLDKMYKYKMDPTRTVGTTERTRDAEQMDGQTDGRTDQVKPIYPPTTLLWGGCKKHYIANIRNLLNYCGLVIKRRSHGILTKKPCSTGHLNECLWCEYWRKCIISLTENDRISIKSSLKFVPKGPINNIPALVQTMAWRRPGNKPLSEPMMVRLLTHICVARSQWVKLKMT